MQMNYHQRQYFQHGAALITSLVILLVLTVLGISAMKSSSLQETLVGNLRDHDLAMHSANSALTYAEGQLSLLQSPPAQGNTGSYGIIIKLGGLPSALAGSAYDTSVWNSGNAMSITSIKGNPSYIIQYEQFKRNDFDPESEAKGRGNTYYRITARGTGVSQNSATLIQEDYGMAGY